MTEGSRNPIEKFRLADDAWNNRDPERVALAYTVDSRWRNRAEVVDEREEIVSFLTRKWARELDYRLIKELGRSKGTSRERTPTPDSDPC
ncbi:hypothetical protein GCM10014715_55810 [Streptomyces spiralis]|uniref:Nuclear transport factor 2 family protein n=1 Tax=Streptomyces spiralis TaxID=66376 RepID=A0A919A9F6_9ACTN|nr:hypothetical protein GCM10014715_55810 [Streptomyces spiralis]